MTSSIRSYGSGVVFDPRPTSLRESNSSQALERLRCDLLDLRLLKILVPSLLKIEHDHCYHQSRQVDNVIVSCTNNINKSNNVPSDEAFPVHIEEKTKTAEKILEDIYLTLAERLSLEEAVTGNGLKHTVFILLDLFYLSVAKHCHRKKRQFLCFVFVYTRSPLCIWGKDNKVKAKRKYVEHMCSNDHTG